MIRISASARRASSVAVAIALALAAAPRALANGRSPASVSVHLREGSTTDLAIWTTWGFLIRRGTAGFQWMCENALKVGGSFDPDLIFRADGSIFATSFEGLLVNHDSCVFEATGLGSKFISSVAESPDGAIYAAAGEPMDSKIYRSVDGGVSFPVVAEPGANGDWWESLEVARRPLPASSTTYRVYLSGFRVAGGVKTHLMRRSDDNGATFLTLPIPQAGTTISSELEIAAVSPSDPDLVFTRVTYATGEVIGDRIYRSPDGGQTWTPVLDVDDSVPGFVVRANGEVIAASATKGTWRSTDGGLTFVPQATSLQTQCLVERADGTLFACAQNFDPDNMAVGSSTDGTTWTKVFRFSETTGPLDCAVDSLQCSVCQLMSWCALREQFGIAADPTTCAEPGIDESVCSGGPPKPEPMDGAGCCGAGNGPGSLLLALGLAGLLARRRRRGA
ncbi:MAG: sialidase family protein [Kofleriaceae bacterium]